MRQEFGCTLEIHKEQMEGQRDIRKLFFRRKKKEKRD